MRTIILTVLAVGLAGCVTTDPVYMKNPNTGQVVQCGPYDNRALNSMASAQRESQCIQDYKEQGFVRSPFSN